MSRVARTKSRSLYVITCSATGLQYVGITGRPIWVRFGQHFQDAVSGKLDYPLYRAIREHGQTAFTIKLVDECLSRDDAYNEERRLIAELGTIWPRGYNPTRGGIVRLSTPGARAPEVRMKVPRRSDVDAERLREAQQAARRQPGSASVFAHYPISSFVG